MKHSVIQLRDDSMSEWKNTEWQEKLKNKSVRYWICDEIEEIIKEESIDRNRIYEFSKTDYKSIINGFYYAFAEYEKYPIVGYISGKN